MNKFKLFKMSMLIFVALLITGCSTLGDDAVACTATTVPANTEENCIAGGNKCASCEGKMCKDNTWPWPNDYWTTVYVRGTCSCRCQ